MGYLFETAHYEEIGLPTCPHIQIQDGTASGKQRSGSNSVEAFTQKILQPRNVSIYKITKPIFNNHMLSALTPLQRAPSSKLLPPKK